MSEHKYITCTGFGGTGSSVISDLMKEFDNVGGCGSDFEFTLAFDMNGISDLQHYIEDDFERSKVSEGIYRFIEHTKKLDRFYSGFIGDAYSKSINSFINKIIGIEWNGTCVQHMYRYNLWGRFFYYRLPSIIQLVEEKMHRKGKQYESTPRFKHKLPIYFPNSEGFISNVRCMYKELLDSFDKDYQYEYLCFDQLVPAYNYKRYINYFPNLKVICIDRDPRDLYLLNKMYWKEGWIPSENVEQYIKWYKLLRIKSDYSDNANVLHVQFEDTIYKYEETLQRIISFLGQSPKNHINKRKFFNPDISIKNTALWKKDNPFSDDIERITCELKEYCYRC